MNNQLKLVNLKAACEAQDAIDCLSQAAEDAQIALHKEYCAAQALEDKFYAEYNDEERDSGMCNARDTASEYSLYENFGVTVERSTEFWQLAIDSAQLHRDCN